MQARCPHTEEKERRAKGEKEKKCEKEGEKEKVYRLFNFYL